MSICLYVYLSVPSLVCAGFEVFLVVRLPSNSIHGLFKRFPMGVFHRISVLIPHPSSNPPLQKWQFSSKQSIQLLKYLATAAAVAAPTKNLGDCRAELLYASQPFRRFSRVHCALLPMLIWPFYTLNPQLYPSSITCFLPIVKIPSRKKVVPRQK